VGEPNKDSIVTKTVVEQIRQALHDVLQIYRGYGTVVIEIRAGKITRIGMEVWTWNNHQHKEQPKDDGC